MLVITARPPVLAMIEAQVRPELLDHGLALLARGPFSALPELPAAADTTARSSRAPLREIQIRYRHRCRYGYRFRYG